MTGYQLENPATRALDDALRAALDAGRQVPCVGRVGAWWTSDDPAERARAVLLCRPCPALAACHYAAEALDERHGVWAGADRSKPAGRKAASLNPPTQETR